MSSELENNGVVRLNDGISNLKNRTICVLGLPRSGTSMVSSIMHNLGIFMGDDARAPTFEDGLLKRVFDLKDDVAFTEIVDKYDARHEMWGFKLPRATYDVSRAIASVRNPALIVVFREPLSVQIRKNISQKNQDVFDGMKDSFEAYIKLISDLKNIDVPMLLVSYDKVAGKSKMLIDEIADFCGITSDELKAKALDLVDSDKEVYLDQARFDKTYGVVESVEDGIITGWAIFQAPKSDAVLEVEVLSGKNVIGVVRADIERRDLSTISKDTLAKVNVNPVYLKRNLKAFDMKVGFEINLNAYPAIPDLSLRVKSDRVPFFSI